MANEKGNDDPETLRLIESIKKNTEEGNEGSVAAAIISLKLRKDKNVVNTLKNALEEAFKEEDERVIRAFIRALRAIETSEACNIADEYIKKLERAEFETNHMVHLLMREYKDLQLGLGRTSYIVIKDKEIGLNDLKRYGETIKDIGLCLTNTGLQIVSEEDVSMEFGKSMTKDQLKMTKDAIRVMIAADPETNFQKVMEAVNKKIDEMGCKKLPAKQQVSKFSLFRSRSR